MVGVRTQPLTRTAAYGVTIIKTSAVERRSVAPVNDDDRLTTKGMEVVITVPVFKAKTTRVVKKDETGELYFHIFRKGQD